jgi:hypothetical protein
LSHDALDNFRDATGYDYAKPLDPEFFSVEPGLIRSQPYGFSLIITLKGGYTVEIPNEELEQSRRVINRTGQIVTTNITEARVFNRTVLDRMVLSKAFLSRVRLLLRKM